MAREAVAGVHALDDLEGERLRLLEQPLEEQHCAPISDSQRHSRTGMRRGRTDLLRGPLLQVPLRLSFIVPLLRERIRCLKRYMSRSYYT
jgi:hypothetical protein